MKVKKSKVNKVWSTAKADLEFSKHIRKRDGQCVLCKRKPPNVILTCSHFWGRFASSTRYDEENCDALCYRCHYLVENAKQGAYREFKMKQLGEDRYKALENRYYQGEVTRREAIEKLQQELQQEL